MKLTESQLRKIVREEIAKKSNRHMKSTLAARYNAKVQELMPHHADSLMVDETIDDAGHIDDIVFRRGEYLGGMAAVILAIVK